MNRANHNQRGYGLAAIDRPTWMDCMSWLAIRAAARGRHLYFGGRFQAFTE